MVFGNEKNPACSILKSWTTAPIGADPFTPSPITPATVGINDAFDITKVNYATTIAPLIIHLDLGDLIELNQINEKARSGLISPGEPFAKNPKRPELILKIVKSKFSPLGKKVSILLGKGSNANRFLKVRYAFHGSTRYCGNAAQASSRTKLQRFRPIDPADKGVTAYVYEGAVSNEIMEHLKGVSLKVSDIENIFATAICHELGHNLGLEHVKSINNFMFDYWSKGEAGKKNWLMVATKGSINFTSAQIQRMSTVLAKP